MWRWSTDIFEKCEVCAFVQKIKHASNSYAEVLVWLELFYIEQYVYDNRFRSTQTNYTHGANCEHFQSGQTKIDRIFSPSKYKACIGYTYIFFNSQGGGASAYLSRSTTFSERIEQMAQGRVTLQITFWITLNPIMSPDRYTDRYRIEKSYD